MKPNTATALLIEWGCLTGAIVFLAIGGDYHPRMNFAIGLLTISWAARWARTGRLTRSTPIDVPLLLFFISALVALWAAPNRLTGLVRLYLFLAAVTLFYALVNSGFRSLKIFSTGLTALAGVFGILLASQYDWAQGLARFQLVETMGIWLNQVIPHLALRLPHWNVIRNISASLLAVSLPVALLGLFVGKRKNKSSENITVISWRNSPFINHWSAGLSLALIIFGLILTESRTPWMVFGLIFALWIWWWLSGSVKLKLPFSRIYIFLIGLGVTFTLAGMVVIRQPQSLSIITKVPGPDDYLSRGEIYPQSWRLAQDTALTGGGLAAFPALYSAYIRVIPHNAFLNEDTGNNAYLNLLVEQGWLGGISYVFILITALIVAIQRYGQVRAEYKPFVIAGIVGLAFILLHGSVHATLVASRAIPALFIPAGLALSGSQVNHANTNSVSLRNDWAIAPNGRWPVRPWHLASAIILAILFAVSLFAIHNSLLSNWYADLGAVHMSQVELTGFPSGKWDNGSHVVALSPAENLFQQALQLNPNNRTAHHRLGLIAMLRRDFPAAVTHLGKAHELDPFHRGVRKSLGYSYIWAGQPESALPLLADIPEAGQEMSVYVWWWSTQSRPDLSARAKTANLLLGEDE